MVRRHAGHGVHGRRARVSRRTRRRRPITTATRHGATASPTPRGSSRTWPPTDAVAYHVAAARELFEEAGVLLARDAGGEFVSLAGDDDHARFKQDRADVHGGSTTLRAVVERERLRLALDALVLFAHWVTPPIDTRQFDTRFFMTRVPPHQTPAHDDTETTHSVWMTPSAAIAQSQRGDIVLPPPTWSDDARARAVRVGGRGARAGRAAAASSAAQPLLLEQDGLRMLLMPGDPLHPDPAGDEPLAETRFVFVDGRWRPGACRR